MPEEQNTHTNTQNEQNAPTGVDPTFESTVIEPKHSMNKQPHCVISVVVTALISIIITAAITIPTTYHVIKNNTSAKEETSTAENENINNSGSENSTAQDNGQESETVKITRISDTCMLSDISDASPTPTMFALGAMLDNQRSLTIYQCDSNLQAIEVYANPDYYKLFEITTKSKKALEQTFEFSIPLQMIAIGSFGNGGAEHDYIFVVLQNGTIFYSNAVEALNNGEFQFKQIDGISDAILIVEASYPSGATVLAKKADGGYYDLSDYMHLFE